MILVSLLVVGIAVSDGRAPVRETPTRLAPVRLAPVEDVGSATAKAARGVAAAIAGTVVDTAGAPVANADVRIAALSLVARTDSAGRYRLSDVAAGTHTVIVRAIGFEPSSATVTVTGDGEFVQGFTLRRSVNTLDSVTVRAARPDPRMAEFEENRRVGLGKFLTRADLESRRVQSMSNIMAAVQGVGIVRGMGNRGWILSRRIFQPGDCNERPGRSNAGNASYIPDEGEKRQGLRCACYAQVYLDNTLMNPGQPADPFDVNQFNPDQIEAVEWYATPASTPAKYAKLNSGCGVYVMHTRRPKE